MITAALVAAAALCLLLALAAGLRAQPRAGDPGWGGAFGGAALAAAILLLDHGQALRWRYGVVVAGARVELPGVGLMLGLALLAAVAGALLTAAALVAGSTPRALPRVVGRRLLILAAGMGSLAGGLLAWSVSRLASSPGGGLYDAAIVLAATGLLAAALAAMLSDSASSDPAGLERRAAWLTGLAALCSAAAVIAAGGEAWSATGGYLAPRTLAVLAAALVTLVARERTAMPNERRVLALAALVAALAP